MHAQFSNCYEWVSPSVSCCGMKRQEPIIRQVFPCKNAGFSNVANVMLDFKTNVDISDHKG